MPRSCFDGYLTPECFNCPDWKDGSDGKSFGCGCSFPIMLCPHFKKVYEEDKAKGDKQYVSCIIR